MQHPREPEFGTEGGAFSIQHHNGMSLEIEGLTDEERLALMMLGIIGPENLEP